MLVRVSCKRCRISSLWTDDPESFLSGVCLSGRGCEAQLVEEAFAGVEAPERARPEKRGATPKPRRAKPAGR